MMNIFELLKSEGLEIPEEQKDSFQSKFFEKFKTKQEVEALQKSISEKEAKFQDVLIQLEESKKQVADFQSIDINALEQEKDQWKKKAEETQGEMERKVQELEYQAAAYKYLGDMEFSSEYARKGFTNDFLSQKFELKDGAFVGADDFINAAKEKSPATFRSVGAGGSGFGVAKPVDAANSPVSLQEAIAMNYNEQMKGGN